MLMSIFYKFCGILFLLTHAVHVQAIGTEVEKLCEHAAIFTTHDLINSEESNYLFGIVSSLQMMWCKYVDVLVTDNNSCKTDACFTTGPMKYWLKASAKYSYRPIVHIISAQDGDSNLRPIDNPEGLLTDRYDVFILVGATKLPNFRGIGKKINFFICDFPNDQDIMQPDSKVELLAGYDGVISSSYYSRGWYLNYIRPYFLRAHSQGFLLPDVHLVLPPVAALKKQVITAPHFSALNNTIHISFYGDFFSGERNHGHDSALSLLTRMQKEFSYAHLHLYMLGRKMTKLEGTDEYISNLQAIVQKGQLSVDFIFDPTMEQLSASIGVSLIFW
jgi:hypothetical protein